MIVQDCGENYARMTTNTVVRAKFSLMLRNVDGRFKRAELVVHADVPPAAERHYVCVCRVGINGVCSAS